MNHNESLYIFKDLAVKLKYSCTYKKIDYSYYVLIHFNKKLNFWTTYKEPWITLSSFST